MDTFDMSTIHGLADLLSHLRCTCCAARKPHCTYVIWLIAFLRLPLILINAKLLVESIVKLKIIVCRLIGDLQAAYGDSPATRAAHALLLRCAGPSLRQGRQTPAHSRQSCVHHGSTIHEHETIDCAGKQGCRAADSEAAVPALPQGCKRENMHDQHDQHVPAGSTSTSVSFRLHPEPQSYHDEQSSCLLTTPFLFISFFFSAVHMQAFDIAIGQADLQMSPLC